MGIEGVVAVLQTFARAGVVGWTPAAEAGPVPSKAPKALAPLLAAGRPHLTRTAFGDDLRVPVDLRTLAAADGKALITPSNRGAPGWQLGDGDAVWHRLTVRGRVLWLAPGALPVAADDADLLLLALLGLTDVLAGASDGAGLAAGGLWGEPMRAARGALARLVSTLDEVPTWPDWIHPSKATTSDPAKRVLVVTPAHVAGGDAKLVELGRHSWSDTPFLFYTRAQKEHLRVLTREELPANRPADAKDAARAVGAWLVQTLEGPIVANLAFPDGELRVYKKQLFGQSTGDAFRVLRAHDYHPVFLGPTGTVAWSLDDGVQAVRARIAAARAVLDQADRDSPTDIAPPTPVPRADDLGPPPPKVDGGRPSLRLAYAAMSATDLHASWSFGAVQADGFVPGAHLTADDPSVVAITLRSNAAFLRLTPPYTGIAVSLRLDADDPVVVKLLIDDELRQRAWDAREQSYRSLRLRPFHDVEHGPTNGHKEWHAASKLGGTPAFIGEEIGLPQRFRFVGQLTDDLFDVLVGACVYLYADLESMEFRGVLQREA